MVRLSNLQAKVRPDMADFYESPEDFNRRRARYAAIELMDRIGADGLREFTLNLSSSDPCVRYLEIQRELYRLDMADDDCDCVLPEQTCRTCRTYAGKLYQLDEQF